MKKKIKTVFIGTDRIGSPLLRTLSARGSFQVELVITQPDRPAGRKMMLQPSPIKETALDLGLQILQPENINEADEVKAHLNKAGADLFIVVAYGQMLKQAILSLPKLNCMNVHASLLPKHRGASPIQNAILSGEDKTGYSLMKMTEKMDAGPVYYKHELDIEPADDRHSLMEKMSHTIAKHVPRDLIHIIQNHRIPVPQDDSEATYCMKITKAEGLIDWKEDAEIIHRKIRAFADWPTAYTFFKSKRLVIHKADVSPMNESLVQPGQVFAKEDRVLIQTGQGCLEPIILQPEGKKPQVLRDFMNGHPDFINTVL